MLSTFIPSTCFNRSIDTFIENNRIIYMKSIGHIAAIIESVKRILYSPFGGSDYIYIWFIK